MFITLWGCCLLCLHLLSALKIKTLTLYKDKMVVEPGSRLLISCHYAMDNPVKASELLVEWGITRAFEGSYEPVIRVVDSLVEPLPESNSYNERAQMFLSLLPRGNCSLIINPVFQNDSGAYQIKMFLEGNKYDKSPSIGVHVVRKKMEKDPIFKETDRKKTHSSRSLSEELPGWNKMMIIEDDEEKSEQDPSSGGSENHIKEREKGPEAGGAENHIKEREHYPEAGAAKNHAKEKEQGSEAAVVPEIKHNNHKVEDVGQPPGHPHTEKSEAGADLDPEILKFAHDLQAFQRKTQIPMTTIAIIAIGILVVIFVGCVGGCVFCILYCKKEN